jgi:sulfur carrier protein
MNPTSTINLLVNGQEQACSNNLTMPEFLLSLGLNPRLVAVEYNGEILHRQHWEQTFLQAGDRLEIVTIVGGG